MDNIYLSYYYLLIDYLYKIQRIENKIENNCDNVFSFYRNLLQENWSILTYIFYLTYILEEVTYCYCFLNSYQISES